MNILSKRLITVAVTLCITASSLFSASYNLQKSTPVGSWQLRQELTIDSRGHTQMNEIKTSVVGKESREDVDYLWVEMAMDAFRVKDGAKGRSTGEHVVIKVLVEKSLFKGSAEDVFSNLRGLGSEIIMQTGDSEPILIENGGMIGGAMLQALGTEINYQFDETGSEKITVPAGKFKCKIVEGSGTVETKILFKTLRIKSDSKQWTSDKVPFGIVKIESTSTMNGEMTTVKAELLDFGKSGAESEIKATPQKLEIPSLKSLFGG